jgi:hypothetical protein
MERDNMTPENKQAFMIFLCYLFAKYMILIFAYSDFISTIFLVSSFMMLGIIILFNITKREEIEIED